MHILDLSIAQIHAKLVAKETTPLLLAKEAIARARANDDNAFELITESLALSTAETLTQPEPDNLLWGIPFAIKDNFSTAGLPTTSGSNILNGYQPLYDATVYKKLIEAKAVLIGKTTLDELAMGGTGMTGHLGKQFNPYDPTHSRQVGGSSSGSAIVVASGIVPFSLGSDTGDSVRKPASYTGLVGFKPTWGKISRYGLFPFAPSLDHVGYFTRSVADAALILDQLAGYDPDDATSAALKHQPTLPNLQVLQSKPYRIAILKPVIHSIQDGDILAAFNRTVEHLIADGCQVEPIDFPENLLAAIYPAYMTISCAEATSNNANLDGIKFGPFFAGQTYQDVMHQARSHGFSELIKRRFVIGSYVLMKENQHDLFLRAQKIRGLIIQALNRVYEKYDAIYLPAAPTIAPKFTDSSDRLSNEYLIADSHLALGNFAGLPSITIPIGFKSGMPFGVNVMTKAWDEFGVLHLAQMIEKHTGYRNLSYGGRDR